MDITSNFVKLLDGLLTSENHVQDYIEKHSQLMPLPILCGHGLHFDTAISKFPLDVSLVTDWTYLTKDSIHWKIVFVEIEHPQKRVFTNDRDFSRPSADFTAALAQIDTWRDFVDRNSAEVLRRLAPLRQPLSENPVEFHYVLVYGRREEYRQSQRHSDRIHRFNQDRKNFRLLSFDSLISHRERATEQCNVLRLVRNRFAFKHLHVRPSGVFAYMSPDDLEMDAASETRLKEWNVDVDAWKSGKKLKWETSAGVFAERSTS